MVPIDEHGESNMTKSNLLFSGKLSPFKFLISGQKLSLDKFLLALKILFGLISFKVTMFFDKT